MRCFAFLVNPLLLQCTFMRSLMNLSQLLDLLRVSQQGANYIKPHSGLASPTV
jgi:hypothetical protein